MSECGFILSLLTLDNLYSPKTAKGRINLLIFIVFKVLAPTWPLMLTHSDSIPAYEDDVMKHFKVGLSGLSTFLYTCVKFKVRKLL